MEHHWNNRVIYHDTDPFPWYGVHEVSYNPDGTVWAYTENPVALSGEDVDDLKKRLEQINKDIAKDAPVLKVSELPGYPSPAMEETPDFSEDEDDEFILDFLVETSDDDEGADD